MARIRPYLDPASPRLPIAAGDDAAVTIPAAGSVVMHTIDTLVEGIDFERRWIDLHALGRRALAISLSDVAGMGGDRPQAVVSLCLPPHATVSEVEAFYRGLREMADATGAQLVGGDLSATPGPWVITIAVLAEGNPGALLRRSGARPGWAVAVTGCLGGAAAGLRELQAPGSPAHPDWIRRWRDPIPRLAEGRALALAGVRVGGDISDGLLRELQRIAEESGTGADIDLEQVPVEPGLPAAFSDWATLALAAGEDFELVCAGPQETLSGAAEALSAAGLAPLHICGQLTDAARVQVLDAGRHPMAIGQLGFDHFATRAV